MVNNSGTVGSSRVDATRRLVEIYLAVVAATLVALTILSAGDSSQATSQAWGHAVAVAIFAAVLMLRLRAAQRGSAAALHAVGIIAAVLVVVNLVEAVLPGAFPGWMRVEMVGIAILMAAIVATVLGARRR